MPKEITRETKLRVSRATNDFAAIRSFYVESLGFQELAKFEDHEGFDGLILGHREAPYHLEFVKERGSEAPRANSKEPYLVFYLGTDCELSLVEARMAGNGFYPVKSHNPYWDRCGLTFEDSEGYRCVVSKSSWGL
jgi:catechol 2,3-dioxygenase-like lactoylglutathione lyase family enzyme